VSHDLRTPLAAIQTSAESLCRHDVVWTEEQHDAFATAILQEARWLGRFVEDLLEISRIEAGKLHPDRDWYPVDSLVDDILTRLEPVTDRHQVTADVPDTLPPVPLDYEMVAEVLFNLVENAAKYTPPGSAIHVSASTVGDGVRIVVEDDGPGIPQSALPH